MLFLTIQTPKMQHLLMLKSVFIRKDQRVILCAIIWKINIVIENILSAESSLLHNGERPSNYFFSNSFTHYQAEQMKKDAVCVQIFFLSKHTGETGETILTRLNNFIYTPVIM